jgi:hypothetical protein
MDVMKTEKWFRRSLVLAAMSASVGVSWSGAIQGMQDAGVSRSTGKTPVQSASQGTTVNGELQKLFQQSGQEMPSMRSQDLPNAQNMQSQLVRRKPAEPVKKENMFKRFWGKVTGRGSETVEAPTAAPVPPSYLEPVPAPSVAGPAGGLRRTVPSTASGAAPGAAGKATAARPAFPSIMRPSATAPAASSSAAVPAAAGHSVRPRAAAGGAGVTGPTASPVVSDKPARLVQPGAAPAFMPQAEAAAAATAERATAAAKQVSAAASSAVNAAKKPTDFLDPFGGADVDEASDPLDLDSIAEAMKTQESAAKQQATAAAQSFTEGVQEQAAAAGAAAGRAADSVQQQAAAAAETFAEALQEQAADAGTAVQEAEQALKSAAEENPFTGVGLDESLDEFSKSLEQPAAAAVKAAEPEAIRFEESAAADDGGVPTLPAAAPAAAASVAVPSEQLRSLPDEKLRVSMENDERQRQLMRIRERGVQPGFKGFCPVALRDHRELVDADPTITAQFGLQTYAFSSTQARELFESDPTRYAPAAGGSDVVVSAREGVERPGRLDFALWFRGRLYMFESRDSMSEFHASPRSFAVEQ